MYAIPESENYVTPPQKPELVQKPQSIDDINGVDCTLEPPTGLDVNKVALEILLDHIGIPALTIDTLPEAYRRILIYERLTQHSFAKEVDRHQLLHKYLGTTVATASLSNAAFKNATINHAWSVRAVRRRDATRELVSVL